MKKKWLIAFSGIATLAIPLSALSCTPEKKNEEINKVPSSETKKEETDNKDKNNANSSSDGQKPDPSKPTEANPSNNSGDKNNDQKTDNGNVETPSNPKPNQNSTQGDNSNTATPNEETGDKPKVDGESGNQNNTNGTTTDTNGNSATQNIDYSKAETFAVASSSSVFENDALLPGRLSIDLNLDKQVPELANSTHDFVLVMENGIESPLDQMENNHGSNQYAGYIDNLPKGDHKAIAIKQISTNKYLFFNNENRAEGKAFTLK
ncbi:hypothetical protein MCANPG14_00235 [Mycoplasmopsis canis PG 14]|uniref:hypothetical protein n=1 Tax=Mycoplasmopsis canis TaxID=29555 RepID=UPI00025AE856|nr:hypothetical protein [Mycoplasmopsis canis]EIE41110.1 hypothetical protein MCANPG14_00235 [Mycoplasmopsis canis PG 14]